MKPENFENALNELPTGDDIYNCTCKSCVDGSIKRMTPAPVTAVQRDVALKVFETLIPDLMARYSRIGLDYSNSPAYRALLEKIETIRAALSAPVAKVDVDALIDEVVEKIVSPKEHAYNALLIIAAINETLDYITAHYRLTPKTPEGE